MVFLNDIRLSYWVSQFLVQRCLCLSGDLLIRKTGLISVVVLLFVELLLITAISLALSRILISRQPACLRKVHKLLALAFDSGFHISALVYNWHSCNQFLPYLGCLFQCCNVKASALFSSASWITDTHFTEASCKHASEDSVRAEWRCWLGF